MLDDLEIVEKYNKAIKCSIEYFENKNKLEYKE